MSRTVTRPERPYLGSGDLDDLVRMNTELVTELWILRDRVTVLEHLLEQKQLVERKQITDFVPSGALAAELAREREALVQRVVGAPHARSYDHETLSRQADIG